MTLGDVAAHVRLRDGGGLVSDGDWGKPKGLDSFAALRKQWFKRIFGVGSGAAVAGACALQVQGADALCFRNSNIAQ